MALFQASILDINGVPAITSNGSVMTIMDYSNYAVSIQQGAIQANFIDFRKIKFINPDGTSYLFSSLGDGDALTIVAAGASLPIVDTYSFTTGSGVYTVILYTIPTWNGFAMYTLVVQPYVYYNGVVYKGLRSSMNDQPDISPASWEVVTDIDLVPSKYRVEQKFVELCSIQTCFANKVKAANCSTSSIGCNWSLLPQDKNFTDAERLDLILSGIPSLLNANAWSQINDDINLAKQICCCS